MPAENNMEQKKSSAEVIMQQYKVYIEDDEALATAMKEQIQTALDEGLTEFRVETYTGSVSDEQLNEEQKLREGEKMIGSWSGYQGQDNNSEFHTLIARKPEENKGDYQI